MVSRYCILSGIPLNRTTIGDEIQKMISFLLENLQTSNSNRNPKEGIKKYFVFLSQMTQTGNFDFSFLYSSPWSLSPWADDDWAWWRDLYPSIFVHRNRKFECPVLEYFRIYHQKTRTLWAVKRRVHSILQWKVRLIFFLKKKWKEIFTRRYNCLF